MLVDTYWNRFSTRQLFAAILQIQVPPHLHTLGYNCKIHVLGLPSVMTCTSAWNGVWMLSHSHVFSGQLPDCVLSPPLYICQTCCKFYYLSLCW